jgi:hypothetical protein
MKQILRVWWLLIIAALVGSGLWFTDRFTPLDTAQLLDRPWVDHMPHSEREPFRVYLLSHHQGENGELAGGYIQAESSYKVHLEMMTHQEDEKEITFTFLHDNVKAVSEYRIERIPADEDDIDLKMTLARDPRTNGQS